LQLTGNSINVTNAGTYFVVVSNSCGTDTAYVNIITESVTAFFTSDVISGNGPLAVNFTNSSSSSAIAYSWSFGDGNSSSSFSPTNIYQNPGVYNVALTVTNANGCSDTYTIQITVLEDPSIINIPNVFSPNNDGINEVFVIENIDDIICYPTNRLEIYNRWGVLVYETEGYDNNTKAFRGISEGRLTVNQSQELPTGTYFYILQYTTSEGRSIKESKYLYISR